MLVYLKTLITRVRKRGDYCNDCKRRRRVKINNKKNKNKKTYVFCPRPDERAKKL